MNKASLVALCWLVSLAACVSDPVKAKPGTIDVMTSSAAGTTADPTGAAGTTANPTGAAGATVDPTGAAGGTTDPTGAAGAATDPSGTAGAHSVPGNAGDTGGAAGATGAGVAGSSGAAGAASTAGTTDTAGADAGASDTGSLSTPEVAAPPPITDPCDHRTWTFTPSVVCTTTCAAMADSMKLPANAIDANTATRYTTGITQGSKGPEVVILTFPKLVTLAGLTLVSKGGDGPIAYQVEFSLDGANFAFFDPSLTGPGSDNLVITFPAPTKLLALRITQTGVKKTNWWSIHELTATGCAPAP